jgi:hypothetical protein
MATYKLSKEQKGKNFLYTVTDENGNVISKRTSKREYVACTADGEYYFGRMDLIGKGDHGSRIARISSVLACPKKAYTDWNIKCSLEEFTADCQKRLKALKQIAYLLI